MAALAYLAVAAALGLYRVGDTGPLWPDGPRYANAGAMMRDFARSGEWHRPVRFAEGNYARYPAFSVPYHPPAYPAALGAWFLLTGVSYESARVFVALSWAVAGWLFYCVNLELGIRRRPAFAAGLLLLTTPPLALWCRDTMSEVPSLVPIFGAALFWLRWLRAGRWADGLLAFALIELAFFSRVTTAGVVPGLLLYGAARGGWGWRGYAGVGAAAAAYLAVNAAWVSFAARYAAHEMAADGKGGMSARLAVAYFDACLTGIVANGAAAVAAIGLLAALGLATRGRAAAHAPALGFWMAWLASYTAFKCAVPTTEEVRHFFTAIPAFAGIAAVILSRTGSTRYGRVLSAGLVAAGVGANVWLLAGAPRGVVGYDAVARALADGDRPGNVLLACPEDQDLIFRFRAASPDRDRYFVRSDRTLAVRVSGYANVPAVVLGRTERDVLDVVRAGRVRYVVTGTPAPGRPDTRPDEFRLVDRVVADRPDLFRRAGDFPLTVEYLGGIHAGGTGTVTVWENLGAVADGPPALPILIPTAGMSIRP